MRCLDEALTKEAVLERIDSYLHGELSFDEDKQFTDHILECEYCQDTLLLYKMMLRVGKENTDELFNPTSDEQGTARVPESQGISKEQQRPARVPFTLWKDNQPIHTIEATMQDFSWTGELKPPGLYTLLDQEGQTLLKERVGDFLSGTIYSTSRHQTRAVTIAVEDGVRKGHITIRLEEKEGRVMLTLETQE